MTALFRYPRDTRVDTLAQRSTHCPAAFTYNQRCCLIKIRSSQDSQLITKTVLEVDPLVCFLTLSPPSQRIICLCASYSCTSSEHTYHEKKLAIRLRASFLEADVAPPPLQTLLSLLVTVLSSIFTISRLP